MTTFAGIILKRFFGYRLRHIYTVQITQIGHELVFGIVLWQRFVGRRRSAFDLYPCAGYIRRGRIE